MQYTSNYNLRKPEGTDIVNIDDLNYNADILDQKLKEVEDKANNAPPNSVNDAAIGSRTPDQSQAPASPGTGTLTQLISWLANRIKAITGKTNWWDAPPTTLQAAKTHMDAAAPHSGHETPAGAQAKAEAAAGAVQAELDAHKTENASTSQKGHVQLSTSTTSTSTSLAATASAVKTVNDALTSHKAATAPHSGHATTTALDNHVNNKNNPHNVTAEQVGAPTQAAFDAHVTNINSLIGTLQHQAAILKPEGGKLWHFDTSLESTDGIKPLEGAVATLRPYEGKFGGAVAVEEGTTNLVPSPHERYKPVGTDRLSLISASQGLEVGTYTISFEYKFDPDPELSPPPYFLLYGISSNTILTTIPAGAWEGKTQRTFEVTSNLANLGVSIYGSVSSADSIPRGVTFYNLQIEQKPFATSFVDGTRANGRLGYEQFPEGPFTVAVWGKTFDFRTVHRIPFGKWNRFYYSVNPSNNLLLSWIDSTNTQRTVSGSITIDPLDWHFYVLTWDGTTLIGYVDGDEHVRATPDMANPGGTFGWGNRNGDGGQETWNGLLDEGLILPYAATEEEIKGWYEAKKPFIDQDEINTIDQEVAGVSQAFDAHESDASAHHTRYTNAEAVAAVKAADGAGSGFDADLLDGKHGSEYANASHSHGASDLPSASTSAKGIVQLSTSTSSTSTSLAATPSAVKAAYDLANNKADSVATVNNKKAGYAVYAP